MTTQRHARAGSNKARHALRRAEDAWDDFIAAIVQLDGLPATLEIEARDLLVRMYRFREVLDQGSK